MKKHCISYPTNVSVNSNWVHPPGNPRENFFERVNPGHPGNFCCLIPLPRGKNDGRIPGERNFPKLEETASYASINLTGYHPPGLTARPIIFPSKSPPRGQLFIAKLQPLGRKKRNKIPTPGHNLPSSNAKISMK